VLSSIPKPYTLNKKEAKMESNSFHTKHARKVSLLCVCLCLSFAVLSLSLSLSLSLCVEFFGSLEADTYFEEEELRFLFQTRSLERLRNNKL
jgi:hypothetical protein